MLQPIKTVAKFGLRPIFREDMIWEMRRRFAKAEPAPPPEIRKILVICHGNICRSPYAERWIAQALPDCEVTSAGLQATPGSEAYPQALEVAAERGVDLSDHRSQLADAETLAAADLILGMVGHHLSHSIQRTDRARETGRVLGHYLPSRPFGIQDPWGEPVSVFRSIFDQIEVASGRLVEQIRAQDG